METKLKPKEKLFCIYYCHHRSSQLAASMAGYNSAQKAAAKLLGKKNIRDEIQRLDSDHPVTNQEIANGYRQFAFGSSSDAFKLLFCDELPHEAELESMNLLNISEIKRPKNGGIEIKFFDRLKALEKLSEISSDSHDDKGLPFYEAIERSAAAIKDEEDVN